MIGEQFVDAPQSQFAESGGIEVGVHVDELRRRQDLFDRSLETVYRKRVCRAQGGSRSRLLKGRGFHSHPCACAPRTCSLMTDQRPAAASGSQIARNIGPARQRVKGKKLKARFSET